MSDFNMSEFRIGSRGVNDIFVNRWSPRAMSGESLSEDELMGLFEAARWAPSSFNSQPWRFVFVTREDEAWSSFFDLLVEFNQLWARNAGALIIVFSRKNFEHNEEFSRSHSFDSGAAWQNLALQGSLNGFVCHGIGGFDHDKARIVGNIPLEFEIEAMIAIGKPGSLDVLPERMRKSDVPSSRKDLSELVFRGKFSD